MRHERLLPDPVPLGTCPVLLATGRPPLVPSASLAHPSPATSGGASSRAVAPPSIARWANRNQTPAEGAEEEPGIEEQHRDAAEVGTTVPIEGMPSMGITAMTQGVRVSKTRAPTTSAAEMHLWSRHWPGLLPLGQGLGKTPVKKSACVRRHSPKSRASCPTLTSLPSYSSRTVFIVTFRRSPSR